MPMIDAFIPDAALGPEAESRLMKDITDILLEHEAGLSAANERAQAVSLVFLHRPKVYVGGRVASSPRYRFVVAVPEGQYADDHVRSSLVRQVTEAVARAEGSSFDDVSPRTWVFPIEVADGSWGGRGGIRRLPEIMTALVDAQAGELAQHRLRKRRQAEVLRLLEATLRGLEGE